VLGTNQGSSTSQIHQSTSWHDMHGLGSASGLNSGHVLSTCQSKSPCIMQRFLP